MTKDIASIWADFHKELKGFIYNKTRNQADTDDILQEVFVKIMHNMDKVSRAENLRQYLFGIVRNAVNDYFKNQKAHSSRAEIKERFSEAEANYLNETIAECCIKPFIDKLPASYKEALIMTEFQNVSQKELANKLNISYSGAKSRVQRGKEKLKELILKCCAYQIDKYGNIIDATDKRCGCA